MSIGNLLIRDNFPASSPWFTLTPFDLRVSWEVNAAGMLTFKIPATLLVSSGWSKGYSSLGAVVQYAHTNAGFWAGIVTNVALQDGIYEFTAQSFLILLKKKMFAQVVTDEVAPGVILKNAIDGYNTTDNVAIKLKYNLSAKAGETGYIDQTSRKVQLTRNPAMQIYDELLPMITDDVDMEIAIDYLGNVQYQPWIGKDVTQKVTIGDNAYSTTAMSVTASVRASVDLFSMVNHLRGIGVQKVAVKSSTAASNRTSATSSKNKPQAIAKAAAAASTSYDYVEVNWGAFDSFSQTRFGPLMERRDYPNMGDQTKITNRLKQELTRTASLKCDYEVELPNVVEVWGSFREGDIVMVRQAQTQFVVSTASRVMTRALDVDRGVMTLALRTVVGL